MNPIFFGDVTMREVKTDYVPSPIGPVPVKKRISLAFDLASTCGQGFINIAIIHEPLTKNPVLEIRSVSGTAGVGCIQRILVLLEEWRKHKGLEISMAGEAIMEFNQ